MTVGTFDTNHYQQFLVFVHSSCSPFLSQHATTTTPGLKDAIPPRLPFMQSRSRSFLFRRNTQMLCPDMIFYKQHIPTHATIRPFMTSALPGGVGGPEDESPPATVVGGWLGVDGDGNGGWGVDE